MLRGGSPLAVLRGSFVCSRLTREARTGSPVRRCARLRTVSTLDWRELDNPWWVKASRAAEHVEELRRQIGIFRGEPLRSRL